MFVNIKVEPRAINKSISQLSSPTIQMLIDLDDGSRVILRDKKVLDELHKNLVELWVKQKADLDYEWNHLVGIQTN